MAKRYIILDTETTGTGELDRVIQLGFMVLGEKKVEVQNEFFSSDVPINFAAMEVHGITPDMLEGKSTCKESASYKRLLELNTDENYLIIHNAKFDIDMLKKEGFATQMKVIDTLLFFAELKGVTGRAVSKKAKEYLKRFDLWERRNSKIEDLSKGNQQKIQFIATILHDPEFIILDEPFSGLDPINTNLLKEIILEKKKEGKIIIFSTHLMEFAEKMCDHIAMIDRGKIILSGSMSEIKSKFAQKNVSLNYEGDISFLKNHSIVKSVSDFGNSTGIELKEASHSKELLKLLVENNITVNKFDANEISLHEIFVKLAGGEENNQTKGETADV